MRYRGIRVRGDEKSLSARSVPKAVVLGLQHRWSPGMDMISSSFPVPLRESHGTSQDREQVTLSWWEIGAKLSNPFVNSTLNTSFKIALYL